MDGGANVVSLVKKKMVVYFIQIYQCKYQLKIKRENSNKLCGSIKNQVASAAKTLTLVIGLFVLRKLNTNKSLFIERQ